MGLLDGSLKKAIAKGFKGKLLKGTLSRPTAATTNAMGDAVPGTPVVFAVEGFVDGYSEFRRRIAGIPEDDMRIILIAGLIKPETRPLKDDEVVFSSGDFAGMKFKLRRDGTDPAGAAWECPAYKVG